MEVLPRYLLSPTSTGRPAEREREREEKAAASFYDLSYNPPKKTPSLFGSPFATNSAVYLMGKRETGKGGERGKATTLYPATATARTI
jgi:hypothetical protein